jgi:prepilin-type N-terminal cleavage/methylation domain-containing protein
MKTNKNRKRGFTLVELLVVIAIIAALAALSAPMIINQIKRADRTEAISNARQIGIAFFSFQEEYSSLPDADTQTTVEENNEDSDITASTDSANGYFRQLFISGITSSESMFFAKTGLSKKGDGALAEKTLEAGENAYGYIMNQDQGLTTGGNASRITAVTPLDDSGSKFNLDPFDSKAVCLKMDNSAVALTINSSGEVVLGGGKKLLDTGAGTIWGTSTTPQIVAPEAAE